MSKCRIAGFDRESIVNGPGIRFTVYFQGCFRACKGCQNKQTWNPYGGTETDTALLKSEMDRNKLITGLSLSGGEPFLQVDAAAELADYAHSRGWTVWCWTGFTLEELQADSKYKALLDRVDVLIDGAYVDELRSLELPWRGSSNQNVIDMHGTVK